MLWRHALSRVLLLLVLWLVVACHSLASQENSEPDEDFVAYLSFETENLRAFYAARDGRFVWQHSESVAAFAAALNTLQSDGLNVADYQPGAIMARYRQLQTPYTTASDRLRFELSLSRILLTALTHLQRARWLLRGEASAFILVDIAGYRISYFRPNGEIWRSRIVVGQPYLDSAADHLSGRFVAKNSR